MSNPETTPAVASTTNQNPHNKPTKVTGQSLANTEAMISIVLPLVIGGAAIYYLICPRATDFLENNLELKPNLALDKLHHAVGKVACDLAESKLKLSSDFCSVKASPYVTTVVESIQKYLQKQLKDCHNEINKAVFCIGFSFFGAGVVTKSVTDKVVRTVFHLFKPKQNIDDTKLIEQSLPSTPTVQKPI